MEFYLLNVSPHKYHVIGISYIILSLYQITHFGDRKSVEFSPHHIEIKDPKNPKNVKSSRDVCDFSRLYEFDIFTTFSHFYVLVVHTNHMIGF